MGAEETCTLGKADPLRESSERMGGVRMAAQGTECIGWVGDRAVTADGDGWVPDEVGGVGHRREQVGG